MHEVTQESQAVDSMAVLLVWSPEMSEHMDTVDWGKCSESRSEEQVIAAGQM